MSQPYYAVAPSEPAVYVEIYLPRKAELQGILYDTLTAGFRLEAVRKHFLKADAETRERIALMLERGWDACRTPYTDDEIRAFPRLFFGYTTYDVDGVYLRQLSPGNDSNDGNFVIMEEGTQILRIIFRPLDIPPELLSAYAAWMREQPAAPTSEFSTGDAAKIAELRQWIRYVGLFLFGFILYRICGEIVSIQLSPDAPTTNPPVKQDEIWVSSLWNLILNPLELK